MMAKKPSAAQLAQRKKFTAAAKAGKGKVGKAAKSTATPKRKRAKAK